MTDAVAINGLWKLASSRDSAHGVSFLMGGGDRRLDYGYKLDFFEDVRARGGVGRGWKGLGGFGRVWEGLGKVRYVSLRFSRSSKVVFSLRWRRGVIMCGCTSK